MQNPINKGQLSNLTSNDFEFISKLGKGSFGVVHKVRRKSNKTIYVLKQINVSRMKSKMRGIALNEVKILKSLENPYIVKYYDSFIERDQLNIVMEYCEGGDLAQYIKSHFGKPLNETKIWKFFIQMCIGLNYIHSKKILHRDIKSLNIFLTKEGDIRIGDLGVAKILADSVNFAHTMVGTPYYLSPEMCEEKPYNEKSDIWALGCVLYELCAQKHPFQAHSQGTLILKIIKGRYSPIPGTYSQELIEIVNLCLNKDYKKRPTASALLNKSSVIEKARSLNIPLQPKETNAGLEIIFEKPKAKENEIVFQNKNKMEILNNPPSQKDNGGEKNDKESKSGDNKEGKINIFLKAELPKAIIGEDLPNKFGNENRVPANHIKNPTDLNKQGLAKGGNENKPRSSNEKPDLIRNIANFKHKENPLGPELIGKAAIDGKKPYFVINSEKVVQKEKELAVNKEERNAQRVRKGAPADLGRFARIVGNQQKLVKKVNIEPPKIFRPPANEDKEKAPKIKSPLEPNRLSLKKLPNEEVGITEEELNQVKNLPDVILSAHVQKEQKKEKSPLIYKAEDLHSKRISNDMKKPASGDNAKPIQPSVEPKNIDIQPKIEINVKKEIAEEIISKPQENIAEVNHGVEEREEEEEEPRNNEEEAPNNKDEEDLNQCEENEEEKIEQERVFKDKWRQDYNSYQEVRWKVSEEGKLSNQKGLVFKGNEEKEEEIGEFEYEESEEKQEDLQEENDLEENENVIIQEESCEEEEEEEENDEIENNDDVGLGMPQMMNQEVLTKKLEKCIKKREKTLDLIKKITSNSYIKAIGDHMFAEIVNFFKLKLESDDIIDEEDQDEIENFLRGKLNPEIQTQVIFNIYRLLGLQIELQKCENEIDKYSAAFS